MMPLYQASVWRRLRTRMEYHQKLVEENRNKAEMTRCERKIKRLVLLLETLNAQERAA